MYLDEFRRLFGKVLRPCQKASREGMQFHKTGATTQKILFLTASPVMGRVVGSLEQASLTHCLGSVFCSRGLTLN